MSPRTYEEISQFLNDRNAPLHISGNDNDTDEILSMSMVKSVLLYEPEEMIVRVQAGISLHELQEILDQKGQWIPTLVAEESPEKTLGAAVAMDHYNPRAKSCGMLRTTILGGTFCTTDGEIFKSGSRVVKSVAGYDIHRAFCGSRGLFGVILDLTLKVQPKPEMFFRFFAPLNMREKILRFYPSCFEEYDNKLLVEFSGFKEDITNDIEEVRRITSTEELDEKSWYDIVQKLSMSKKENPIPNGVKKLLSEVKRVFDPKGILV